MEIMDALEVEASGPVQAELSNSQLLTAVRVDRSPPPLPARPETSTGCLNCAQTLAELAHRRRYRRLQPIQACL